jgi:hypothetical protein
MTCVDRIDSVLALTMTGASLLVFRSTTAAAAAAAEVETAKYRHRHRNRNYLPLSIQDSIFESRVTPMQVI